MNEWICITRGEAGKVKFPELGDGNIADVSIGNTSSSSSSSFSSSSSSSFSF